MGENYWSSVLNTLNVLADPLHIREGILFYRHIGSGPGKLFLREVVRGVCFRVPAIIVKHPIVCFLFQYR